MQANSNLHNTDNRRQETTTYSTDNREHTDEGEQGEQQTRASGSSREDADDE